MKNVLDIRLNSQGSIVSCIPALTKGSNIHVESRREWRELIIVFPCPKSVYALRRIVREDVNGSRNANMSTVSGKLWKLQTETYQLVNYISYVACNITKTFWSNFSVRFRPNSLLFLPQPSLNWQIVNGGLNVALFQASTEHNSYATLFNISYII